MTYAEQAIDKPTRIKFNQIISEYYEEQMKQIYRSLFTFGPGAKKEQPIMFVLQETHNMECCLLRYFDDAKISG